MKKPCAKGIEAQKEVLTQLNVIQEQLHAATERQIRMEEEIQNQFWMLKEVVTAVRLRRRHGRR